MRRNRVNLISAMAIGLLAPLAFAGDFRTYNNAPQVNYNPQPQANFIDSAMNGYERGQDVTLRRQEIELRQQEIDAYNQQSLMMAEEMALREEAAENISKEKRQCLELGNLEVSQLQQLSKTQLIKAVQICTEFIRL